MNTIKASLSHYSTKTKPTDRDIHFIKSEIAERIYSIKDTSTLRSFVKFVGTNGCAFCPATFNVTFSDIEMSEKNFQQIQLFVLEFNGSLTFEEFMRRADTYNLPVLFVYEILGSVDRNRFRAVFLNDVPIEHIKVAEIIIEALLVIFPEADPRSRDITQIYLGGRKLLCYDENVSSINIEVLIRNMCLYWKDCYGDKNYSRKIYGFSNRTGLALNIKKYLDVSIVTSVENKATAHGCGIDSNEDLLPNSIIYKIDFGNFSSFDTNNGYTNELLQAKASYQVVIGTSTNQLFEKEALPSVRKQFHYDYRADDLYNFKNKCKLLTEFESGTRILNSRELFGIATTLINVDTGANFFAGILQKYSYFNDSPKKYSDWKFYLNYLKKTNCPSLPCNYFCPYINQCCHAGSILNTKLKYHEVKKQTNCNEHCNEKYHPVEIVAEELKTKFAEMISAPVNSNHANLYAINAPTGVGKSTTTTEYMREHPDRKYMVATATVDLKNKGYDNALAQGIHAIKTPSLVEYKNQLPAHIWNYIQSLYQTGKYRAVAEYIKEVISDKKADTGTLDILKNYLQEMRDFYKSNDNVFTTHNMLAALDYWTLQKYDAVIIDEDPLLNHMVANQVVISMTDLVRVLIEIPPNSKLAEKIKAAIEAARTNSWITLPEIPYDKAYSSITTNIDISSFCLVSKFYFYRETEKSYSDGGIEPESFVFFKPFSLNPRIKYIILSATVNPKIYNYVFGANRVNYYECHKAKYIGTLNQYTYYTASHAFVNENPDIVKIMLKLGHTDKIITFKGEYFAMDDCYFGKTTGIDTHKGEDINVLGTFHRPEWLYKLFVFTYMERKFADVKDAKLSHQEISYNGYRTKFMTFDKSAEILREVQLWMIGSELEQAVGRARLSRCDCTVTVFSNLPLSQANIIEKDYNKE